MQCVYVNCMLIHDFELTVIHFPLSPASMYVLPAITFYAHLFLCWLFKQHSEMSEILCKKNA
jgi:hypothetical protein